MYQQRGRGDGTQRKRGIFRRGTNKETVVVRDDPQTNSTATVGTFARRRGGRGGFAPTLFRNAISMCEFHAVEAIGAGAFATVYRAYELISHTPINYREVALKRINMRAIKEPNVLDIIYNEVKLFKTLKHVNIVNCHYSFEEIYPQTDSKYLVMVLEYVDGGDLEAWIRMYSTHYRSLLPEAEIWSLFRQIANAVDHIHSKGILHRDLKPANVLLTRDRVVKLADFGLSRQQNVESRAQTVCGTPYYMSPERIGELPYTFKSDIWSLGCILYEMAALKSPFFGEKENVNSLIQKILHSEYPPIPEDCYTKQLIMLIDACLSTDVKARPSAAGVLLVSEKMVQNWSKVHI